MRTSVFAAAAAYALAACAPAPTSDADAGPVADLDYRVRTTPSMRDQRFLIEFTSLTDRELCISANDWPTADGALGYNRDAAAGDEPHRVHSRDTVLAFVRFDQLTPAQREGDGIRYVEFTPEPAFCGSGALQ